MFSIPDVKNGTLGEAPTEKFNDLKDSGRIRSIIQENPNRKVDHLVLAQDPKSVKTALIIGPLIYGTGQGPGNTRSIQAPTLAKTTLEKGQGFRIAAGKSVWSNVHIRDLGSLFAGLSDAAVGGKDACWNHDGVYATENGKLVSSANIADHGAATDFVSQSFGEIGQLIAWDAHSKGLIKSAKVDYEMTPEEADKVMPHGSVLLATNAVTEAERARTQLNWKPTHESLEKTISDVVDLEAKRLGKANKAEL